MDTLLFVGLSRAAELSQRRFKTNMRAMCIHN